MSIVYDALWLFYIQDEEKESSNEEGGLEEPIKNFSLSIAYINFGFKVSVFHEF
jgi:hypothetical protein